MDGGCLPRAFHTTGRYAFAFAPDTVASVSRCPSTSTSDDALRRTSRDIGLETVTPSHSGFLSL